MCTDLLGDEDEVSVLTHGLGTEMPSIHDEDRLTDASQSNPDEDEMELRLIGSSEQQQQARCDESDDSETADEDNFTAGLLFDLDDTELARDSSSSMASVSAYVSFSFTELQFTKFNSLNSSLWA